MHRVPASDHMPTPATWSALTASQRKQELLAEDLYFRECWADVDDIFGPRAASMLGRSALLTFKCDGVVGRRMRRIMEFLDGQGFRSVGVSPFRHNRHSMRELWRYNWNVYPTDRLNLMTIMHTATDTLLLILDDTCYDGVVPGSARLADLKGPADPGARGETQLRSVLNPPNRVINFVHVADEPVDVVCELAIFLDRAERRDLLTVVRDGAGADVTDEVLRWISRLEGRYPAHDLDLGRALHRVETSVPSAEAIARLRAAASDGPAMTWDELTAIIDPRRADVDVWDFVCIAAASVPAERESCADLAPVTSPADWINRARDAVAAAAD